PASAESVEQSEVRVRFNFKDAPYEQVLDFMARQTGLPVIREAEVPKAPVTFIGASDYTIDEALDILNRMLLMHGVQLRGEQKFLFLSKLENMRAVGRVAVDGVPEGAGAAEVDTSVVPLENAAAAPTADQIKPLVSPFG